jgi:hypothetical protein
MAPHPISNFSKRYLFSKREAETQILDSRIECEKQIQSELRLSRPGPAVPRPCPYQTFSDGPAAAVAWASGHSRNPILFLQFSRIRGADKTDSSRYHEAPLV